MFELKKYQRDVLRALEAFLTRCRNVPIEQAYRESLAEQQRIFTSYGICLKVTPSAVKRAGPRREVSP
jgi:hypothetical protein